MSKSVKLNKNFCCFEFQPQSEQGHETYFFLTKLPWQLSLEANSFLAPTPNLFQLSTETCVFLLFSDSDNLGSAYPSKSCKGVWETSESTYEFGFQCLLGFHFEDGRNFELPKSHHIVQNRISALIVNFQRS
jgi:hypothetical protein